MRSDVDWSCLARDTIADHLPQAIARGQDLGFDGPAAGVVVHGDALLLRELLSNLVDNALRYTPDGGVVTVNVRRGSGGGATLAVTDTGPGVPSEERERVFRAVLSRQRTVVAPGTGLGLAIVRTIAAAHGASLALHPALASRVFMSPSRSRRCSRGGVRLV